MSEAAMITKQPESDLIGMICGDPGYELLELPDWSAYDTSTPYQHTPQWKGARRRGSHLVPQVIIGPDWSIRLNRAIRDALDSRYVAVGADEDGLLIEQCHRDRPYARLVYQSGIIGGAELLRGDLKRAGLSRSRTYGARVLPGPPCMVVVREERRDV